MPLDERRERPGALSVLGLVNNALLIGLFWHFEFYALGFEHVFFISSMSGSGSACFAFLRDDQASALAFVFPDPGHPARQRTYRRRPEGRGPGHRQRVRSG